MRRRKTVGQVFVLPVFSTGLFEEMAIIVSRPTGWGCFENYCFESHHNRREQAPFIRNVFWFYAAIRKFPVTGSSAIK